jgi:hypothetical protein
MKSPIKQRNLTCLFGRELLKKGGVHTKSKSSERQKTKRKLKAEINLINNDKNE